MRNTLNKLDKALIGMIVLILLGVGGGAYGGYWLWQEYLSAQNVGVQLKAEIKKLERVIAGLELEKEGLEKNLETEKERQDALEKQLGKIAGSVDILEKLKNTDKELLQKYSKVYFLNEHYTPTKLSNIDKEWVLNPDKEIKIHSQVESFLDDMFETAKEDGIDLRVVSGFRSFADQTALKSSYKITYGSGANKFSADQGYSEHQLGTTIDLTIASVGGAYDSFANTEAYQWLLENAHKHGFILSYPKGNTYYQFEPWHWRFVGEDLARDLHKDGKYFYDLDQREIDKYLVSIFD
jgi:zinc D-Ala-D-Ala carboxypeptidase